MPQLKYMSKPSQEVQGKFLCEMFEQFELAQINYCVLRNYETLPDSLDGSDLDMAVDTDQLGLAADIIMKAASQFGADKISDYTSSGRFVRLMGQHEGAWWGAPIDLFPQIEYRGVGYFSFANLIDDYRVHNGIQVVEDKKATLIAFVKELVANGKSRKNYFEQVVNLNHTNEGFIRSVLSPSFKKATVDSLLILLEAGKEDPDEIKQIAGSLRSDILGGLGLGEIFARLRNLVLRCRRLLNPPGMCIAIMGTDGAGKTTVINAMTPCLEEALHSKIHYEHMRPNWLPALGAAVGKKSKDKSGVNSDPHAQKSSGFVGSLFRLGYYSLDYTIGYWVKVFPRMVKRPGLCLFDRYYEDFIIDPKRMRINLPRWIVRLAFLLAPKPGVTLCLGTEPTILYQRKPETSEKEVARQVGELKAYAEQTKRAAWVDTGGSIEVSTSEALRVIAKALSSRLRC